MGEGLNAHVYRAVSNSKEFGIKQVYALKVLKRKGDLNHFKKEFAALSKVGGKHLVKLLGWKKHKGHPGLLLEFIDGVDLERLLSNSKLTHDESNWIYHEVLQGLIELNSCDLYHGDLSPKNIMISRTGEIKLIDFGLTKWRTKQVEVTPEFAAPELLGGEEPSFKYDLFSLNKIFEHLELHKSEQKNLHLPQSLREKVANLLTPQFQTQPLVSEAPRPSPVRTKFLTLIFMSLAFFKPVSAQNTYQRPSTIFIRSSKWMSVKLSNQSEWCFTPCSLKAPHLGSNKIEWKSQTEFGSTQIFVQKDGQTILLADQ